MADRSSHKVETANANRFMGGVWNRNDNLQEQKAASSCHRTPSIWPKAKLSGTGFREAIRLAAIVLIP
jgi:hypothetical protein